LDDRSLTGRFQYLRRLFHEWIKRAFEAEGIEFAFPTRTTYLAQDDRRPLYIRVSSEAGGNDPIGRTG